MSADRANDIIDFWIGPAADDPAAVEGRSKLWYQSTPGADDELRDRFGEDLSRAERGELDDWCNTAHGTLALVILLDQFSRNLHRGTADAFANDDTAAEIAEAAISSGLHLRMSWIGRVFLYHPFEHSERLARQERSVVLFTELADAAPDEWMLHIENFLKYAIEHRDVVRRFGRFPHRNKVLARHNTAEEQAYLDAGSRRYGQ